MKTFAKIFAIALTLVIFTTVSTFAKQGRIVSTNPSGTIAQVLTEDGDIVTAIDKGGKLNIQVGGTVEIESVNGNGNGKAPQFVISYFCFGFPCNPF